jgi:pilus assembly protein CpaF
MVRMSQAVALITDRVRDRVRRESADLGDADVAERLIRDEVQRYSERALSGSLPLLPDEGHAASQVLANLTGFGAL